jgi:hypothetical protein
MDGFPLVVDVGVVADHHQHPHGQKHHHYHRHHFHRTDLSRMICVLHQKQDLGITPKPNQESTINPMRFECQKRLYVNKQILFL